MSTQRKDTHAPTPEQERTAEMLRELYRPGVVDGLERRDITAHLHRITRNRGVTICKSKADTYLAVLAQTGGAETGGLETFRKGVADAHERATPAGKIVGRVESAASLHIPKGDVRFGRFGIEPGDTLHLAECNDFRDGETYVACRRVGGQAEIGHFIGYDEHETHWRCPVLKNVHGEWAYHPNRFWFYRIVKIDRPSAAEPGKKKAKTKKGTPRVVHVRITEDLGPCGFAVGERVKATQTDDLRVGDIAALQDNTPGTDVGRVVAIDADTITLLYDHDWRVPKETFSRSELTFEGRVDPEPVGRWDGPATE